MNVRYALACRVEKNMSRKFTQVNAAKVGF